MVFKTIIYNNHCYIRTLIPRWYYEKNNRDIVHIDPAFFPAASTMTPLSEATSRDLNPGWWHWSSSVGLWTGTSRRYRRWSRRCRGGTAWWVWRTWVTGRDIQSRSLRGGRSPCATGRTKYGKDGADVKEFSQTIHHEVGGHEFVKLLGAILLFWKHSIMRFKTYFVCKGSITNWE